MNRRPPANSQLPVDSIHQGRVVRIEDYGAFVQIKDRRGLVHISQLASVRVEKVTDVVELNESVWVKVVDIETTDGRDKIRLTMKNVPQDGTAVEAQEAERHAQGLSKGIEQNLNSTIGMAVARDPMAQGLILKQSGEPARVINGYALLEEEEEEDRGISNVLTEEPKDNFKTKDVSVKPMGRGRGATLPAWMVAGGTKGTNIKSSDDVYRSKKEEKKKKKSKKDKSRESSKHSKSSKKRRRRSESPESDESRRKDSKRRGSERESRRRYSTSSDSSVGSERASCRRRHRSRRRSPSDDSFDQKRGPSTFSTVEEARRFVKEMEKRKNHANTGSK